MVRKLTRALISHAPMTNSCGDKRSVSRVLSNRAIDSDTYSAPLRALSSARHCER